MEAPRVRSSSALMPSCFSPACQEDPSFPCATRILLGSPKNPAQGSQRGPPESPRVGGSSVRMLSCSSSCSSPAYQNVNHSSVSFESSMWVGRPLFPPPDSLGGQILKHADPEKRDSSRDGHILGKRGVLVGSERHAVQIIPADLAKLHRIRSCSATPMHHSSRTKGRAGRQIKHVRLESCIDFQQNLRHILCVLVKKIQSIFYLLDREDMGDEFSKSECA